MKKFLFLFVLIFGFSFVSSAVWVINPNQCPEIFQSQQGLSGTRLCGYDGSAAYFYDMTTLSAPSPTTTFTGSSGGLSSGFGLNCEAMSASVPYCLASAVCNRNPSCQSVGRLTECTDWGVSNCGSCGPGYQACDGSFTDANGCEVQTGVTSRGTNVVYGASCSYQCSSGYLDCNGDATGSDGACEIRVGVTAFTTPNTVYQTCTTGVCSSGWMACEGDTATNDGCNTQIGSQCTTIDGKPGSWQSGCACTELEQEHFITNTEAKGWGDFLLFGRQYNPLGWLMNLTSASGNSIGIDNESCIVFSDGSVQCSAGASFGETGNMSVNGTGFFIYLGDVVNRIENIFTKSIDVSDNITLNGTTISDWSEISSSGGSGIFVGKTSLSYNADLSIGNLTGYAAGNEICDLEFSGSHLCYQGEIVSSISLNLNDVDWVGTAWVISGGAKYAPADLPVNDCNGFTHGVPGNYLGSWWFFDSENGGVGRVSHCGTTIPLACCL